MQDDLFYILMVACGQELRVLADLREDRLDARCPVFTVKRNPRHRKARAPVEVTVPVLDGYVFLNTRDVSNISQIREHYNILKTVCFSGTPALLADEDLAYLQSLALQLQDLMEIDFNTARGPERPKDLKPGEHLMVFFAGLKLQGKYIGNDYIELVDAPTPTGAPGRGGVKIKLKDAYVERIA